MVLTLPINMRAEGRTGLLVGGGTIALQKAQVLAAAGMGLRVVAPFVQRGIGELPGTEILRRGFEPGDLDGVALAIAATDDAELNHRVYRLANERGIPANCVDDPEWCDFIFPSILRRGELAIAVSTGGNSPALARIMRQWLEGELDGGFGETLALTARMRREAKRRIACPGARRAISECLAAMALKRRGDDAEGLHGEMEAAIRLVECGLRNAECCKGEDNQIGVFPLPATGVPHSGSITLVGAGPGNPDLITLAGAKALAEAELVVYDRLVDPALLELAPRAERVYCGKTPGEGNEPHAASQARINGIIVEAAQAGKRVVRLKGGDPFIFGRGGEELRAAREAGIEARAIPGVSAALGAAAAFDLPLTHRLVSSSVAFITGCAAEEAPQPDTDWRALARGADTLVLYMGVRHLRTIAAELIAGGRPLDEPVAAIERATSPGQRIEQFTLAELSQGGAEGRVAAPSIVIIGQVVKLGAELRALAELAGSRAGA